MAGHPYFGQWRRLSHPKADLRVVATTPKGLGPFGLGMGFAILKGAKLHFLFFFLAFWGGFG
jgi:hypothetical protein